ncbi:MAG: hypothetical protein ACXAE3_16430 [Candidatus Kariarchaeaceae archaeon]
MSELPSELQDAFSRLQTVEDQLDILKGNYEGLHVRYCRFIDDPLCYELSIPYSLLDDHMVDELQPYLDPITIQTVDGTISLMTISEENLGDVLNLLGLTKPLSWDQLHQVQKARMKLYQEITGILVSLRHEGSQVEAYYGTLYYSKLTQVDFKFAIDDEDIYIIDHSRTSVPDIFRIARLPELDVMISHVCLSSDDLAFYTMI